LPVSGPDAAAFLHAQLMNDVRALADGQWQWTGWLTPKGRVRFIGLLLRAAPDRFLLAVPDWGCQRTGRGARSLRVPQQGRVRRRGRMACRRPGG
jgi:folate-binding Fe-S cluster repair protein YgfZ